MGIYQWIGTGLLVVFGMATPLVADPLEPGRGTQLRQDLLDTVRVIAEYELGAPVEFRVIQLEAEGDLAFARLMPQRPGGGRIDLAQSPLVLQRDTSLDMIDGSRMEVFLQRTQGRWRIYEYAVGSTDAWWYGYRCETFGSFLRDAGC